MMKFIRDKYCNATGLFLTGVVGSVFFSGDALASPYQNQGCSNLGFTVKVSPINPDPVTGAVEVSGLGINTPLANLIVDSINPIARCDTGFSTSPYPGDVPPGKGFVVYRTSRCDNKTARDPEGIVGTFCQMSDSGVSNSGILEFAGNNGPAPVTRLSAPHAFTLQSKNFIGKKIINLDSITNGFQNISTTWGEYAWNLKPTAANVSNYARQLILTYTPTCSASVNNVAFGSRTVNELNSGIKMQANVNISCNDILPTYSIKVSSDVGATNNILKSDNSTVGYSLTWGNTSEAGLSVSNQPVVLDRVITLPYGRRPSRQSFDIPLIIAPVSTALPGADITPGPANSRINIELKFN
ncbi:hypothetical protein VZ957_004538 [Salmonella enterica]|nr:hypothetical protein [Salmonella enterica]